MYKMKKYMLAIGVMCVTSVASLITVSLLTYLFKWQADKAMIGIIISYVLAGMAGGYQLSWRPKTCSDKMREIGMGQKVTGTLILSILFMVILVSCSCLVFHISFEVSKRFFLIWLLVASSSFVAISIRK